MRLPQRSIVRPEPGIRQKKSVTAATSLGSRSAGGTGGAVWSRRAPRARV